MNLDFGDIVIIEAGGRHSSELPFALLADEGAPTYGGDYRWHGLFMDRLSNPTRFGWANLYTSEVEGIVTQLDTKAVTDLLTKAREKGA